MIIGNLSCLSENRGERSEHLSSSKQDSEKIREYKEVNDEKRQCESGCTAGAPQKFI